MKIRTDYVTNSSSSSFVLARKGELTELQKNAIINFVEQKMLGDKLLTPESSEADIQKVLEDEYILERHKDEVRSALKDGKDIYSGWVSFEETDYHYADLFASLWSVLEKADGENFEAIDGSLDY